MKSLSLPRARGVFALAGAALLAFAASSPRDASACGGFFCNLNQPVDQSAERVLYVMETGPDGKPLVTAHIQIAYTGDAKDFSWVLPLQAKPELETGSESIFAVLEQFTAPRFMVNWQTSADCQWACYREDATGGGPPSAGGGGNGGSVQVLLHENVGPYDAVVIQAVGGTANDVIDWLNKNGYQQPANTEPELNYYVGQNFVFLALKLQKDKAAGDLVPIVVKLPEVGPCLPIRLTKIAATPDMPIITWTLGSARAIPKNFLHVTLNEKVIDWMTGGGNYKTVVSKAVDFGAGHAFTTEYAGKTKKLLDNAGGSLFFQKQWDTAKLAGISDPGKFLQQLLMDNWPRTTQVQNLIKKYMPKPEAYAAKTDQEFYTGCIQNQSCESNGSCEAWCKEAKAIVAKGFNPKALAADLDALVLVPLKKAQSQFETIPYLTRLFTTVDPKEMTKDPIYGFNAELPDVSNDHQIKGTPICAPGDKYKPTSYTLEYNDGSMLTFPMPKDTYACGYYYGPGGPLDTKSGPLVTEGGYAAQKVEVLDETGQPVEIDAGKPDLVDKIDQALDKAVLGKASLSPEVLASIPKSTWDPAKSKVEPKTEADAGSSADTGTGTGTGAGTDAGSAGSGNTTTPASGGGGGSSCAASGLPSEPFGASLSLLSLALLGLRARRRGR